MSIMFRLMTANLLNGGADAGHLAEMIDRHRPEVVVTQELGPNAAEVLAARYSHHDLRPSLDHRGLGIASRFPSEFHTLDLPWRVGAWARVDLGSQVVVVATLHLINAVDFPWWSSVRKRSDQLSELFAWAGATAGAGPLIVAGDMNASPRWPAYRRLAEHWEDLAEQAPGGPGTAPTWGWRPGWPRLLRIDHVFGSGVRGVWATVEPVRGSDHAAVLVDIELI
ncbi:MAG TPA: endonuclease/exonuclease/phosphatase family protein [Acidimicrobiia bacterium]